MQELLRTQVILKSVVVHSLSRVWLFVTPWTTAHQASLSFTISCSLLRFMSIESVMLMLSNHLILCRSLLLLPSIFPSIRIVSNELILHIKWPKYWSFSISISTSSEYLGLIFFRIDWLDLLAVQRTLKSLLQHHKHQFFGSQPFYGPTLTSVCGHWKNHRFDYRTSPLISNALLMFILPAPCYKISI